MKSVCSKCNGTGLIFYEDENGYRFQRECECGLIENERMASRLRFANLPEIYRTVRLKDTKTDCFRNPDERKRFSTACKMVKYYLDHFDDMHEKGMGLYMFSKTKGSGKTRMMAGIANELMHERNIKVKFATSMQILDEIKATWDKSSGEFTSEHSLLDALVTTDVLAIDDFGTEKTRDWVSEKFYSIINGRYIDGKVTLFTSNMSLSDLKYDDRITNRIKERTYEIPFPEESVREFISENNLNDLYADIAKGEQA